MNSVASKKSQTSNPDVKQRIAALEKYMNLNSKYHHREKMRFSRTPLLKYIKCINLCNSDDFKLLEEKLKSKKYLKIYEDLEEDDDEDEGK